MDSRTPLIRMLTVEMYIIVPLFRLNGPSSLPEAEPVSSVVSFPLQMSHTLLVIFITSTYNRHLSSLPEAEPYSLQ